MSNSEAAEHGSDTAEEIYVAALVHSVAAEHNSETALAISVGAEHHSVIAIIHSVVAGHYSVAALTNSELTLFALKAAIRIYILAFRSYVDSYDRFPTAIALLLLQANLSQALIQVFACGGIFIGFGVLVVDAAFQASQAHIAFRVQEEGDGKAR